MALWQELIEKWELEELADIDDDPFNPDGDPWDELEEDIFDPSGEDPVDLFGPQWE